MNAENGVRPATPPPRTIPAIARRIALRELIRTLRRQMNTSPARLGLLAESWRTEGQLVPIHVALDFDVLDGSNRVAVAEANGDEEIWAIVHEDVVTPEQKLAKFLAMEGTKSSRSVWDIAFPVDATRRELGLTWDAAGGRFGISPATTSRYKRVTEAPDEVLAALRGGSITLTELVEVMRAPEARRPELLAAAVAGTDAKGLRAMAKPRTGGRRKPVEVRVGRVAVLVPADLPLAELMELLRVKLFSAISKAAVLNLDAASLQKIIDGLAR